jgi:hypothetical protein
LLEHCTIKNYIMDLMQTLQEQLSGHTLTQISQQIGATTEQTSSAANGVFAAMLGGLANNASTPTGLSALTTALDKDHDGSILNDVAGMIGGILQGQTTGANNGAGILGHVLGDKQDQVAQHVSESSGLDMSQIMKLMPILAPIVMGVIGKIHSSNSAQQSTGGGFGDLASILMGSVQSASQSGGFGDLIGKVLGGLMGGQQAPNQDSGQSGGGLFGNILGSILKK